MSDIKPAFKTLEGQITIGSVFTSVSMAAYVAYSSIVPEPIPFDKIFDKAQSAKEIAEVYAMLRGSDLNSLLESMGIIGSLLTFAFKSLGTLSNSRTILKQEAIRANS